MNKITKVKMAEDSDKQVLTILKGGKRIYSKPLKPGESSRNNEQVADKKTKK